MIFSVATCTLLTLVSAHIQLMSPTPRGSTGEPDEIGQLTGPCGGTSSSDAKSVTPYSTPSTSRTQATLKNFKISLTVADSNANVMIYASPGSNPTTFSHRIFTQSYAKPDIYNITLDFSSVPGMGNGPATLQITEMAADTGTKLKYVCADLTITGASSSQTAVSATGSAPIKGNAARSDHIVGGSFVLLGSAGLSALVSLML